MYLYLKTFLKINGNVKKHLSLNIPYVKVYKQIVDTFYFALGVCLFFFSKTLVCECDKFEHVVKHIYHIDHLAPRL